MINGLDISHWQGQPDMGAIKRAGYDFVVLKATEGTYYQDPDFHTNRDHARAAGLIVLAYHFAKNGDPVAEANYFLDFVGAFQHGEGYDLDWEVPGDAPTFTLAFLTQCKARTGFNGGVYLNNYYLTDFDWSKVEASNFSLWYARYDNTSNNAPGTWICSMKQYTSNGYVPGVSGPVDKDVFYGDRAQLISMGYQSKRPAPSPIPVAPYILPAGSRLNPGQKMVDGDYSLVMQTDGNLVVYGPKGAVWQAHSYPHSGSYLIMQNDGNAVVYSPANKPLWNSGTNGKGGNRLVMQSDGNLVIYTAAGKAVWAIHH